MKSWRVAGINFDHMHMPALLAHVAEHPRAEIVGICHEDKEKMDGTAARFQISPECVYNDYVKCLAETEPDIVLMCPATAAHGEWTKRVATHGDGYHIIMEKPFAASLAEADEMIMAVSNSGKQLAINWPLAWYPCHVTSKRLINEGVIGEVIEVHYYDGNKGDTFAADSWFRQKEKGGGSLLDYLGYGVTLGSWFMANRQPLAVTAVSHIPPDWEVDDHSIVIVQYEQGLSKFETRWGTLTSPWLHQPQPKCGFVIVGSTGSIASYDYETTVRVQTLDQPEGFTIPVDVAEPPYQNCVQYLIHCLETGSPVSGPLSIESSRLGQQIVDAAVRSAAAGCTIPIEE
jgi:glucose-fructose oxidoreductase